MHGRCAGFVWAAERMHGGCIGGALVASGVRKKCTGSARGLRREYTGSAWEDMGTAHGGVSRECFGVHQVCMGVYRVVGWDGGGYLGIRHETAGMWGKGKWRDLQKLLPPADVKLFNPNYRGWGLYKLEFLHFTFFTKVLYAICSVCR